MSVRATHSEMDTPLDMGGVELLDRVEPLWTRLRAHHAAVSPHFSAALEAARFEDRRAGFQRKAQHGALRVWVLRAADGRDIGYVVASVAGEVAEVDSLYVAPESRGAGAGRRLMEAACAWLDERGCRTVEVNVVHGNEEALRFYAKLGFLPRSINLERAK